MATVEEKLAEATDMLLDMYGITMGEDASEYFDAGCSPWTSSVYTQGHVLEPSWAAFEEKLAEIKDLLFDKVAPPGKRMCPGMPTLMGLQGR